MDPAKLELMRKQAAASKLISASFGEIVGVLMRSQHYRTYTLADLEWLVVPAVLSNQFMVAEARAKDGGFTSPVGVVLWANVSPEVDRRLAADLTQPPRLQPNEWKSGEIAWLIDAVGAQQAVQGMVQRVRGQVFKGRPVKVRTMGQDGQPTLRVLDAVA
jgi:cytolysin-activating lysine-acyltransferase